MDGDRRRRLARLVLGLAMASLPIACGSDDDDTNASASGSASSSASGSDPAAPADEAASAEGAAPVLPVTFTNADGSTTEITDVSRIVPLNGDLAEVVFALGLGDNVVATDVSATYPEEAAALPKVGYQRTLSLEGILAQEPTVVLGNTDAGPPDVIAQLQATVPLAIVDHPVDLAAPATKIEQVAEALGVPQRGAALAEEVTSAIEAAQDEVPDDAEAPRVVLLYLRGAQTQMIGGADVGVSALLDAALGTRWARAQPRCHSGGAPAGR